jgi:hypothetical protein
MLGKDANLKSWKKCYCLGWITSNNKMHITKAYGTPFEKQVICLAMVKKRSFQREVVILNYELS